MPLNDLGLLDSCAGGEDTRAGGFAWRCRVSFCPGNVGDCIIEGKPIELIESS